MWAVPFNTPIYKYLTSALPEAVGLPIFEVYVGLLTGIFEVGITYLVLRKIKLGKAPWKSALAFGIGFGAVEALILSISPLALALLITFSPGSVPEASARSLTDITLVSALLPVWERLFTVLVHIFSNVLIFYAIAVRQPRWFWLAFFYKSAIDMAAAFVQMTGMQETTILFMEIVVGVWGLIGLLGTIAVNKRYPVEKTSLPPVEELPLPPAEPLEP